jgi:hypothetical protein
MNILNHGNNNNSDCTEIKHLVTPLTPSVLHPKTRPQYSQHVYWTQRPCNNTHSKCTEPKDRETTLTASVLNPNNSVTLSISWQCATTYSPSTQEHYFFILLSLSSNLTSPADTVTILMPFARSLVAVRGKKKYWGKRRKSRRSQAVEILREDVNWNSTGLVGAGGEHTRYKISVSFNVKIAAAWTNCFDLLH